MELSTVVQQYQQVTRDTSAAIENRAEKNALQLTALLSPHLSTGEPIPEFKTLFLLLARLPQHHQQQLEGADQRHAQELGDDAAVFQARDDAASALYDELVQIRSEVEAVFGVGGVAALGMSGVTPKQPALLERYASDIIDRLQKNINLGMPLRKRTTFDSAAAAEELLPLCKALRSALDAVTKEAAEAKETQDAKNDAFAQWESNVPPAILAAKALFTLAGDQEGAARLYTTPASYRQKTAKEEAK